MASTKFGCRTAAKAVPEATIETIAIRTSGASARTSRPGTFSQRMSMILIVRYPILRGAVLAIWQPIGYLPRGQMSCPTSRTTLEAGRIRGARARQDRALEQDAAATSAAISGTSNSANRPKANSSGSVSTVLSSSINCARLASPAPVRQPGLHRSQSPRRRVPPCRPAAPRR